MSEDWEDENMQNNCNGCENYILASASLEEWFKAHGINAWAYSDEELMEIVLKELKRK